MLATVKIQTSFKRRIVLSLLYFGVGHAPIAIAQSAGTFAPIANMTVPRADHTATLLLNGKVLIAGGSSFGFPISAPGGAELYDPSTGVFTATGPMIAARAGHSATQLPDGRVLIAGGSAGTSAELYDPSTGTFSATGDMIIAQTGWGAAALLGNNRVLIANVGSAAQLYDPLTGTFALTPPYPGGAPRWLETATLLPDGRVLLTGGTEAAAWTEIYDPRANAFSVTGNPSAWEDVWTATLLPTGNVLFVGNEENDGLRADAEVYDPATGTFSRVGPAADPHEFAASAILGDGTVLVSGGQLPGGNGDPYAELYAPGSGTFSIAANMTTPRHEHTATLLPDGTVLLAGGYHIWPYGTSSTEIYRPLVPALAPMLFALRQNQGAILHAGTAQIVSASNPAATGDLLEIYGAGLIEGSVIPPQISIGGRLAEVLFFGDAPGYSGLNQINVRMPSGIAPGPTVPVHLIYLGRPSNEVTIGVR